MFVQFKKIGVGTLLNVPIVPQADQIWPNGPFHLVFIYPTYPTYRVVTSLRNLVITSQLRGFVITRKFVRNQKITRNYERW